MASNNKTWVANFFQRVMEMQNSVLVSVSDDKKKKGYGRAAKIIVDGPGGDIIDVWFCEQGLKPKPPDVEIKNTIYMTKDTLLDLITPDVELDELVRRVEKEGLKSALMSLFPRLDFRTAYANGYITVSGGTQDVDTEEWAQILDHVLLKIAFPIVVDGMLAKLKAQEKKPRGRRRHGTEA
jgi:hypothetical protein